MMKNRNLIGLVTFFISIVICITILNFTNSSSKKDYYFDRTFVKNNYLKLFERVPKLNSKDDFLITVESDSLIVEKEILERNNSTVSYKIFLSDLSFKQKNYEQVKLPQNADITFSNKNELFYVQNLTLFKYNYRSHSSTRIKLEKFKIISLVPLKKSKNKFICFGEQLKENGYHTGFFLIDIQTYNISTLKILNISKDSNLINTSLQYSGKFSLSLGENLLTYCCNKYSKVYFFQATNGAYLDELTTKEDVPLPKILKNKRGDSFYARGTTRNTNMGLFLKNGNVFIFSARSPFDNKILVDVYSLTSYKYKKSFKFHYKNFNSKSIEMIATNNRKIILGFSSDYAIFNFEKLL